MEKVGLHVAFGWNCPTCSSQNYSEGVPFEQTDEDKEALKMEFCVPPIAELLIEPRTVKCKSCKERFETTSPYHGEVEDE